MALPKKNSNLSKTIKVKVRRRLSTYQEAIVTMDLVDFEGSDDDDIADLVPAGSWQDIDVDIVIIDVERVYEDAEGDRSLDSDPEGVKS
jgi:hypothetical protein